MTHSIISLWQRAALSALLLRASCPGMDSSSGFNVYREPAYLLVLSIADQHTGLLNMLRSPIFALGSLGVGNRPAAGLHRTIGISATPPSLWPGCELQKYLLWSTGQLNYSIFKDPFLYRKSSEFKASEKLSLYLVGIENGQNITRKRNLLNSSWKI